MCLLKHGWKNFTIFVLYFGNLIKYQVTNWWLKNLLLRSNKEADFCTEIEKKKFSWNGLQAFYLHTTHLGILKPLFIFVLFLFFRYILEEEKQYNRQNQ